MSTSNDQEPDEHCDVPGCDEEIYFQDGDHYEAPGDDINVMCAEHGERFLESISEPSESDRS